MALLNINSRNIKRPASLAKRAKSKSIKLTNGRPAGLSMPSKKAQENRKVGFLQVRLQQNGNMRTLSPKNHTMQDVSETVLAAMGCSIVYDMDIDRDDYSLLTTQTDKELINNPNKFEFLVFKEIKKGKVSFQNVIKNESDSFLKLDDPRPKNIIDEHNMIMSHKKKEIDFTAVASGMYDYNFGNVHLKNTIFFKVTE